MRDLPLLPSMCIGSAASPGWLFVFRERIRDGGAGPADVEEAFDDATRIAVDDQLEAGLDVICDGEVRRNRFVYEMYDRLTGLERLPPARRIGVPGYDRAPKFVARQRLAVAAGGLGVVEEHRRLAAMCPGRPLKIAFPGPLTFARNIEPGAAYGEGAAARARLLDDLIGVVAAEIAALAQAGATLVQLDEPGFANPPWDLTVAAGAEAVNAAIGARRELCAVHVCFGNNASHPYVRRDFGRLLPGLDRLNCRMLLLEFANREMADLERLKELSRGYEIAAGVVDVKSFHEETAEEVAERIRRVLAYVPAERLAATADCGFSALPRWLAKSKMKALANGARLARGELGR
jgi:5-methyltetrahydropteroyltriglutamate--homocysteine methyltransferase